MKPNHLEIIRHALLKVLDANHSRFGLQAPAVTLFARQFSVTIAEEDAVDQLEYLAEKGLAAEVAKEIVRAARAWKITDAGRQYLDEHGL